MRTLIENGVTFAYLSIAHVETIEASIRAQNVDAFNEQCKGLDPPVRLQLWQQRRPDRVSVPELYDYIRNTRQGIIQTLALSIEKAGGEGKVVLEYDLPNAGNLAAHLIGLEDRFPFVPKVIAQTPPASPA